ncbi:MAG: hypothetical protein ACJAUP_002002 [Cellvibrionaceae bacterium]|jgi:hypothetical protein
MCCYSALNKGKVIMYIDEVIVFSLLMILLILIMMVYVGVYSYRHIGMDSKKAEEKYNNGLDYGSCTTKNR